MISNNEYQRNDIESIDVQEDDRNSRFEISSRHNKHEKIRGWRTCKFFGPLLLALTIGIIFGALVVRYDDTEEEVDGDQCDQYLVQEYDAVRNVGHGLCANHEGTNRTVHPVLDQVGGTMHNEFRFMVVGDWGRDGWCCQRDVAMEMNYVAERQKQQFIISTGDNFYPVGIVDKDAEQVKTSWLDVYNFPSITNLRWNAVLGNHDHVGKAHTQIELNDHFNWHMPDYFYAEKYGAHDMLDIVYLDTSPMIKAYENNEQYPEINSQVTRVEEQLKWLNQTLANSKAKWKIVVGHHPIYTAGEHKGEDTQENGIPLKDRLKPILLENEVNVYFSGHDHNMQHFNFPDHPKLHYVISGAGSKIRKDQQNEDGLRFYGTTHGFVACQVDEERIELKFIDYTGNWVYIHTIQA